MGINISEYGLAKEGTGNYEPVATEEELYGRLGLPYIPPELREDTGEIEAAERGELPDLVEVSDVRGDLHVHTNWSDGKGTIESMAEEAIELGYEYLVFCDHSQSLKVANGLSPERLERKVSASGRPTTSTGRYNSSAAQRWTSSRTVLWITKTLFSPSSTSS
jgi:DNA polymerase (family 10)